MRSHLILFVVWIIWLFSMFSVIYTKSCQRFRSTNKVGLSGGTSDCYSYETYTSPRPCYSCVKQCRSTPGCLAVECDSMETTSRCCILTRRDIEIFEGYSTIIHLADITVCLGSYWTGEFTSLSDPEPDYKLNFTIEMRFQGLGHNCSQFSGNNFS